MSENTMSELIITEPPTTIADQPRDALTDLRHGAMIMSAPRMLTALDDYGDKRYKFRDWLLSRMQRGIHYGFSPGCEPKWCNDGKPCERDEANGTLSWNARQSKNVITSLESWQPKESLYAAGADFVCDLMGLRAVYSADIDGWKQLGAAEGMFVYGCQLVSKSTGEIVSEGRGIRQVGAKGGDANNAIKMAMKSAKVCAVLDAYGLRDLFTQDMDPPKVTEGSNPDSTPTPAAPTRAQRQEPAAKVEPGQNCKKVYAVFAKQHKGKEGKEITRLFKEWLYKHLGRTFDERIDANWEQWDVTSCLEALDPKE